MGTVQLVAAPAAGATGCTPYLDPSGYSGASCYVEVDGGTGGGAMVLAGDLGHGVYGVAVACADNDCSMAMTYTEDGHVVAIVCSSLLCTSQRVP